MATQSLPEKTWENTWAPRCENKRLNAAQLMGGLRFGAWTMKDLPPDAQDAVRKIINEVYGKKRAASRKSTASTDAPSDS